MKKKKIIFAIIGLSFSLFLPQASALEEYYRNDNGVVLNKKEYDFMSYMFWEGSQELLTQEDYNRLINSNIMNGELDSNIYEEIPTRATSIEINNRSLKIVKSCSSDCFISVTLTWKESPTIKSYDVMGAYLDGTSLTNTPSTTIGTTSYSDIKKFSNGFGVSILMPQYGYNVIIHQNFRAEKKGTVYASYQHSIRNISLSDSKNYTLSKSGYGGVFQFNGIAASSYDRMNGVSISL